jgi:hypothetical protein
VTGWAPRTGWVRIGEAVDEADDPASGTDAQAGRRRECQERTRIDALAVDVLLAPVNGTSPNAAPGAAAAHHARRRNFLRQTVAGLGGNISARGGSRLLQTQQSTSHKMVRVAVLPRSRRRRLLRVDVGVGDARCGDLLALAGDLGVKDVFDQAIADFSAAYSDKNEGGFVLLEEAVSAGRISIQRGL